MKAVDAPRPAFVAIGAGSAGAPQATPSPVVGARGTGDVAHGGFPSASGTVLPGAAVGVAVLLGSASARASRRRLRLGRSAAQAPDTVPSTTVASAVKEEARQDFGVLDVQVEEEEEESISDFVKRYKAPPASSGGAAAAAVDGPVAVPFLGAPRYRKFLGVVPGDAGFDPINMCQDIHTFTFFRESELKHCRLAMLAAAGWPMSELFQPKLAEQFLRSNDLASNGRAPSILNGGLDRDVLPFFMVFALASMVLVDLSKQLVDRGMGSYGFDPLSLENVRPPVVGGWLPEGINWMAEAELKNGRAAMVAITAFSAMEFVTDAPVVKLTPFFFGR